MNNAYVDLILSRISAVATQQDRQTDKLSELRREFIDLAALLERIDARLARIEKQQAR
jgi:hypothetical protein